jgi:thiol-disulfide isomerase/thioredoxin
MKRSLIFLLAVVLALAGLAIGIAKVRPALPHLAKVKLDAAANSGLGRGAAKPAVAPAAAIAKAGAPSDALGDSSPDDEARVIRFAAHPQDAPPFMAPDLDGQAISTAAWKGKVVLLTFWATWCPPCRAEIPMLIHLKDLYKDRLEIVGVSLDDDPAAQVKSFTTSNRFNFPVVMATREIIRDYGGVPALPTTFVINPDGKVVQKHIGLYRSSVYEGEIRALLGLPVDATVETFEDTGQIFLTNASRATELPDVDFTGLTADQRTAALKQLNSITCTCGCKLTLAQCRINDTSCPISKGLAAKIVAQIAAQSAAPPTQETAPSQPPAPTAAGPAETPATSPAPTTAPDTTAQQPTKPN